MGFKITVTNMYNKIEEKMQNFTIQLKYLKKKKF